jgi:hypothetical protein
VTHGVDGPPTFAACRFRAAVDQAGSGRAPAADDHPSLHRPQARSEVHSHLADGAVAGRDDRGLTPADVDIWFYDDRMEMIPFDEPADLVAISVET